MTRGGWGLKPLQQPEGEIREVVARQPLAYVQWESLWVVARQLPLEFSSVGKMQASNIPRPEGGVNMPQVMCCSVLGSALCLWHAGDYRLHRWELISRGRASPRSHRLA